MQHGFISDDAMRSLVQAAAIRRVPVAVRVAWNEPVAIMRALDAGADGVIVPMVNNAKEARQAVDASRYPPEGYRSWGPLRSEMANATFTPRVGNGSAVCLVMIETMEAFKNLEAILDVPGVDGVFVGPSDFSISVTGTVPGADGSGREIDLIEEIGRVCQRKGTAAGIVCRSGKIARHWQATGFNLVAISSDLALLTEGMARRTGRGAWASDRRGRGFCRATNVEKRRNLSTTPWLFSRCGLPGFGNHHPGAGGRRVKARRRVWLFGQCRQHGQARPDLDGFRLRPPRRPHA